MWFLCALVGCSGSTCPLKNRRIHSRGDTGPYAADGVYAAQRLVVPLFQRPYVWNDENQWDPLWNDVVRVAERVLNRPTDKHHPHFLGAVVLQQVQNRTGQMQERTIIDGQQRLTTLQLLLDACMRRCRPSMHKRLRCASSRS